MALKECAALCGLAVTSESVESSGLDRGCLHPLVFTPVLAPRLDPRGRTGGWAGFQVPWDMACYLALLATSLEFPHVTGSCPLNIPVVTSFPVGRLCQGLLCSVSS